MNPAAGTRKQVRRVVEQVLQAAGLNFTFAETQAAGHAVTLAQEAASNGVDAVIAIGGDGTINEVSRGLLDTDVTLGVIPVGSGNAFARVLGISRKPEEACKQFLNASMKRLDVGVVEDEIFLSTAGVGLDAEVAWQYAGRKGKRRGLFPYVMLTLTLGKCYTPRSMRVILDGKEAISCRPHIVVVANTSQYGNGVVIAPGAVADDGVLDVLVFEPRSLLSIVLHAWRLFSGSIDQMPGVRRFGAQHVCIEREAGGYFQFDGEALNGPDALRFEVKPSALSVWVPNAPCKT